MLHCAAILAHAVRDEVFLWGSNVGGTAVVARMTATHGVPKLVFVSANCLWASGFGRPVVEQDEPRPVKVYGRSKWEGERSLQRHQGAFDFVVLRSPTMVDTGRLGLLTILFDFIREGRRVWVVGGGPTPISSSTPPTSPTPACVPSECRARRATTSAPTT